MKKTIVHITNDYPDVLVPRKTNAVQSLVEGTPEYRHVVYSLNRVSALSGLASMSFGEDRFAVAYGALPKGIFWKKRLSEVGEWILSDLKKRNIEPDLIEAHKFTIEGFIGHDLSKVFDVPLICDIQGYTDINILRKKKSWHARYRKIAKDCVAVFPYAPWPVSEFEQEIGLDPEKCTLLPVVPSVDAMKPAPVIGEDRVLTVFHLDGWKNKNFEGMALAVQSLLLSRPNLVLDVYGGGSPQTLLALNEILDKHNLHKHVRLMGPVENGSMPEVMQQYSAFVMPSKSESYGLVYIEALFSGVPVMFNAKRGISGYYAPKDIGYGADAHDIRDIASGIDYLLNNEADIKKKLSKMQKDGAFEKLRKASILNAYKSVIEKALKVNLDE